MLQPSGVGWTMTRGSSSGSNTPTVRRCASQQRSLRVALAHRGTWQKGKNVPRRGRILFQCLQPDQQSSLICNRRSDILLLSAFALLRSAAPASGFGPVSMKLEDIEVKQVPCKAGISTVTGVTFSGEVGKPACLSVTAKATNPSKKSLYNADVFGRVYDAAGEAAIDATENTRIAYVAEIPPGTSKISFDLTIPEEQFKLGPVQLGTFKATGFAGKNLPGQGSGVIGVQECNELEEECGDPDEAMIR